MTVIFKTGQTPVAVFPSAYGVKGLFSVKMDASGKGDPTQTIPIAILSIQGGRRPNMQMTANLNNEGYYTLFGDQMTPFYITCADLPGTCGTKSVRQIAKLRDMVDMMNNAIDRGNLPTVKVTYASDGSSRTVTMRGYLTDVTFAMKEQYKGIIQLTIQGYVR